MPDKPVRRSYTERKKQSAWKRLDSHAKARWAQAGGWLAFAGLAWGAVAGVAFIGGILGAAVGALAGIFLLGVVGGGIVTLVTSKVGEAGGGILYNPSGSSTPHKPEYSRAQALAVQERWDEAIQAYHEHVAQAPEIPDAYLALARVLTDGKKDYEEAARWLKRARRDADLDEGQQILIGRRLVELYWHNLGEPRRAAPELARLAENFGHTPDGERAARDLAEIKQQMAEEAD